jgi:hypothetical protein
VTGHGVAGARIQGRILSWVRSDTHMPIEQPTPDRLVLDEQIKMRHPCRFI